MKYLVLQEGDWYLRGIPLYDSIVEAGEAASRAVSPNNPAVKVYKLVEVGHYGPLGEPTEFVP